MSYPTLRDAPGDEAGKARDRHTACRSRERPIDLVHLARQTMGDRTLEEEVLGLMLRQIEIFSDRLSGAAEDERRFIAHALKGAARSVGAFSLARAAEALETDPGSGDVVAAARLELRRTADFIAGLRA